MEAVTKAVHPCFDVSAKNMHARVHLPVAPKCNIQCNYCNRKYDCVNESRPGVTAAVVTPHQAVEYLKALSTRMDNISVVGFAGPGDPMANPEETLETMRLTKAAFPEKIFCLSTNGVNLAPYVDDLASLGVTHVTVTINAIDPVIAGRIYAWARHDKKIYRGIAAGEFIVERQLDALPRLKKHGMVVKVNTIVLPTVNDHHIEDVARTVAGLGADVMNCIPVVPTKDTTFEAMNEPSKVQMFALRAKASGHIKMMTHCARCRADAAGLLGTDDPSSHALLQEYSLRVLDLKHDRPYIAAATNEGLMVNLHLGEAAALNIYQQTPNGFRFVEERTTPPSGGGEERWRDLANQLTDCRALLVAGVGGTPTRILQASGLRVIQMTGLIDEGLEAVYNGTPIRTVKKADAFKCGETCRGTASGCA
ncbi:MAG TPA: radical SAM protein [Bacteroidota bacterium]|nr:radical SAM protein [Bacteroidota bacterium]